MARFTKAFAFEIQRRVKSITTHIDSGADPFAMWSWANDSAAFDSIGYQKITLLAKSIQGIDRYKTCPLEFLRRTIARCSKELSDAAAFIEQQLEEDFGDHLVFVPIYGIQLGPGISLNFGKHIVEALDDNRIKDLIFGPFRSFRSEVGDEQLSEELARIGERIKHLSQRVSLRVAYQGSAKGATDFLQPIAERVTECLQFLNAQYVNREDVQIIDHKGAFTGQFMTIAPVLSHNMLGHPEALALPNIRGYPYVFCLKAEHLANFDSSGFLNIIKLADPGPDKSKNSRMLLFRAMQMFSDGERATSKRQALISYIGACETLFSKHGQAELYTCRGMAATGTGNFDATYSACKSLYERRSEAVHTGVSPPDVLAARHFAMRSIQFISENSATLSSKSKIRKWVEESGKK